ncbi:antimicrobial ginkbilobin-2-like protein [Silene latifolia]|uniref:antimicrobial ginkbilobin-2-like protein n=1 Tax=Silene latifolia TaxID=37657 RepID=UPI003D784C6B
MALSNKLITFIIIIATFNKLAISSDDEDFGASAVCIGTNTTTGNPLYQNYNMSVSSLLFNLSLESKSPFPGFFTTSTGPSRAKAYGSYICWGDVSPKLCKKCVRLTTEAQLNQNVYEECFVFGIYLNSHLCFIRYANQSVNEYKKGFVVAMGPSGGKVADYTPYNRTLSTSIEGLIKEAEYGNWTRTNFATRVVPVNGSRDKIHILVQCTPVISAKNCSRCLQEAYDYVPIHYNGTQGGAIIHANCIVKFNNQSFIGGACRSLNPIYLHVYWVILISLFLVFV